LVSPKEAADPIATTKRIFWIKRERRNQAWLEERSVFGGRAVDSVKSEETTTHDKGFSGF
jgi:hypothetical protein